MAQKVQVLLVDDLDGGAADETVTFALDGVSYEIDLKAESADKLRDILEPYIQAGRKQRGLVKNVRRPVPVPKEDTQEIRAWAKANGYQVNDRGRVPGEVRVAYQKAHA